MMVAVAYMYRSFLIAIFISSSVNIVEVNGFEPISGFYAGFAAVASLAIAGYHNFKCRLKECCNDRWIESNMTDLSLALDEKLFGQHLVTHTVLQHVKAHMKNSKPVKALALSFHGGTGTGKNFMSKIIAEHVFKEGMKSKYVHLISATKEFPHEEMVHHYKDQLRNWIEANVSACAQSLFVFDEMDKMPTGLIDVLKPYLDYYENLAGVDYRKAIFIFLSNSAGTDINRYALRHWQDGYPREDIKLKDMENIIMKSAFNTNTGKGLWHSELIKNHLITAYIPFLPLNKTHVRQCIRDSMVSRRHYPVHRAVPKHKVEEVMVELSFYPEKEQAFSTTGCKRVAEKVDLVMQD